MRSGKGNTLFVRDHWVVQISNLPQAAVEIAATCDIQTLIYSDDCFRWLRIFGLSCAVYWTENKYQVWKRERWSIFGQGDFKFMYWQKLISNTFSKGLWSFWCDPSCLMWGNCTDFRMIDILMIAVFLLFSQEESALHDWNVTSTSVLLRGCNPV